MALRRYKPTSPGRRNMTSQDFEGLSKEAPIKSLLKKVHRPVGRNNAGRITTRHKGGGDARMYRLVDFTRIKDGVEATVVRFEYDPNRSVRIALIEYTDGTKSYILAPFELKEGDKVMSGSTAPIRPGNTLPLIDIPIGILVHNIELHPGRGGQLARSAGVSASLLAKDEKHATIKLASGELRRVPVAGRATIGQLGNILHSSVTLGKAGRIRRMGKRPTVRGKAMNPNAHPHGGGEGVNPIGLRKGPKTKWGALALGVKTRHRKNPTNVFIISRRKRR